MEWTADNIRQLRAHAQITQAQLALWLGVTIKQVKHLENRRRNPSGPVQRLLDIYTKEHNGHSHASPVVQVLSAPRRRVAPSRRPSEWPAEAAPAPVQSVDDAMVWGG